MGSLWCIMLALSVLVANVYAAPVSSQQLSDSTWTSRACENVLGLAFLNREFTFTATSWTLKLTFFNNNECGVPTAVLDVQGPYELLNDSSSQVIYTEVTLADFEFGTKTLTALDDSTTALYNSFTSCWPSDTFTTGAAVDVLNFTCAPLGLESLEECPDGERDIIAFYQEGLFLGDRILGAPMCSLPRPRLLETFGLVHPGQRDNLAIPTRATHEADVESLLDEIDTSNVMETIERMSSFFTRYFNTDTGVNAADYMVQRYRDAASCSLGNVEVEEFRNSDVEGPGYPQSSVIGRIVGSADGAPGEALIIIGGHIDSANFFNAQNQSNFEEGVENPDWFLNPGPGADDDITGSGMVLEVFRVLVAAGFRPERTLEFHGYAGEERGLVDGEIAGKTGSELIVRNLRNEGKEVAAYMNFDSIGSPYRSNSASAACNPLGASDNTLGVFGLPGNPTTSNIDPEIRDLFIDCIDEYAEEPYTALVGPNGASDHLSYIGKTYPAGGAVESNIAANGLNICGFEFQRHHTAKDTIDGVDEEYVKQFARATLGFVIEASFVPGSDSAADFHRVSCSSPSSLSPDEHDDDDDRDFDNSSQFSGVSEVSPSLLNVVAGGLALFLL